MKIIKTNDFKFQKKKKKKKKYLKLKKKKKKISEIANISLNVSSSSFHEAITGKNKEEWLNEIILNNFYIIIRISHSSLNY